MKIENIDLSLVVENGKTVRCPKCNSSNIIRVHPFDYIKQCNNKKCSFYLNHPKKLKYQFMTEVHN